MAVVTFVTWQSTAEGSGVVWAVTGVHERMGVSKEMAGTAGTRKPDDTVLARADSGG